MGGGNILFLFAELVDESVTLNRTLTRVALPASSVMANDNTT